MSNGQELKDVPSGEVGRIVGQLVSTGATNIQCTRQNDGNWTIRAA